MKASEDQVYGGTSSHFTSRRPPLTLLHDDLVGGDHDEALEALQDENYEAGKDADSGDELERDNTDTETNRTPTCSDVASTFADAAHAPHESLSVQAVLASEKEAPNLTYSIPKLDKVPQRLLFRAPVKDNSRKPGSTHATNPWFLTHEDVELGRLLNKKCAEQAETFLETPSTTEVLRALEALRNKCIPTVPLTPPASSSSLPLDVRISRTRAFLEHHNLLREAEEAKSREATRCDNGVFFLKCTDRLLDMLDFLRASFSTRGVLQLVGLEHLQAPGITQFPRPSPCFSYFKSSPSPWSCSLLSVDQLRNIFQNMAPQLFSLQQANVNNVAMSSKHVQSLPGVPCLSIPINVAEHMVSITELRIQYALWTLLQALDGFAKKGRVSGTPTVSSEPDFRGTPRVITLDVLEKAIAYSATLHPNYTFWQNPVILKKLKLKRLYFSVMHDKQPDKNVNSI